MGSKKIIHIVIDDKFIDMGLREFEAVMPGIHVPVIVSKPRELRYVKNKYIEFHSLVDVRALIKSPECSTVIFHSLGDLTLLTHIPMNVKVIWLGWGYDYYDRLLSDFFPEGLLLPATKSLMMQKPDAPWHLKATQKAKNLIKRILYKPPSQQSALQRVDLFSPVLDVEYQLARQLNPWFRPDYLPWNYGTVEDDLASDAEANMPLGQNILVGNSATAENNHIEVFDYLIRHVDISGRKIFVPLSYGDEWYRDQVIARGRELFGDQFVPLMNFMSRSSYIDLLQSCGFVFMNHLRQQALGNICIMMLKGAKLYMNPDSVLYKWLKARGAIIDTVVPAEAGSSNADQKLRLSPLSDTERMQNRKVIEAWWGREAQRQKTLDLVSYALR